MKIKDQTRKLATGCFSSCFEVADRTDEVSLNAGCSKHCFEVKIELTKSAQSTAVTIAAVLRLQIELTKSA
ncbi:hypothetical protein [Streptococcus pneumoniae]|uniref:hypothetical protein n=1 Tax=Streptococcus pneumoniae TaxID=1313 RepID=UPI0015DAB8D2|nr:hypothetical protein [Streptococcus pneumoniae]